MGEVTWYGPGGARLRSEKYVSFSFPNFQSGINVKSLALTNKQGLNCMLRCKQLKYLYYHGKRGIPNICQK
jgi:hypothetical protein